MLEVRTAPVTILHRSAYSDADAADPIVWGKSTPGFEGVAIEKLIVMDEDGQMYDNLTLHPSVGAEASAGSVVELTLQIRREQKVAHSAGGREYVTVKDKFRVTDASPAS